MEGCALRAEALRKDNGSLYILGIPPSCLLAGIVNVNTNCKCLGIFLGVVFFFSFFVVVLLCFFTVFLSYIPKETSKCKGKKAILRTRMKARQKSRGKKNTERRLKESIGGPAELSSRGLGFLQRKLRYMFVCLHFQIGAVGAHSEENKSNANFWGGDQYSRLLTGPPGY